MSDELKNCHDCGAKPGSMHSGGCDTERCPRCGRQQIGCNCIYEVNGFDMSTMEEEHPEIYNGGPTDEMYAKWEAEWGSKRLPWTGMWPGVLECRELGFWAVEGTPGNPGWKRVPAGTPGAVEDLNRFYTDCDWNPETQKWVKRP